MKKPILVVMAAGMGSRYGGLKQIDPIGPNGEIIIDYSIYDAVKAGFGKVVFVIKKELAASFKEIIGNRIKDFIEIEYVYQDIRDVPEGCLIPDGRVKPWGTGHAVYSCREVVDGPFAVINADDFYGASSYVSMARFLNQAENKDGKYQFSMVGFLLENTLTDYGHVARGICTVNSEGLLESVRERTKIERYGKNARYVGDDENWQPIDAGTIVSMNLWGFTTEIFKELESGFPDFLDKNAENLVQAEYFLPEVVGRLVSQGKADVKVLPSHERWYGVTYREDAEQVKAAIRSLVLQGKYPEHLWR